MFIAIDTFKNTFDSEGVVWWVEFQFAINIRLRRSRMVYGIPICYKYSTPKEFELRPLYVAYILCLRRDNLFEIVGRQLAVLAFED